MAANSDLPQDILLEIFSRLPAKTVGKCRTLSKHWQTDLSTKSFIKKHLITRQQTIEQENVTFTTEWRPLYVITSPTKNYQVFKSNNNNIMCNWSSVIGSCNGLILLHGYINACLLLLNPITFKQVTIHPHLIKTHRQHLRYGFGYDSCADDYKLVSITTTLPESNYQDKMDDDRAVVLGVYSVKTGVWKRVVHGCYPYGRLVPPIYKHEGGVCGAFLNGSLHWLICKRGGFRGCIAAFDLAYEVFRGIPLPYGFVREIGNEVLRVNSFRDHNMPRTYWVSVVGGCLVIVDNFGNGDTELWIMKEYGVVESWVRFHIEAEDGNWDSIVATLCYVEDGELLCLTSGTSGYHLFSCDLKGGTMRKVVIGNLDGYFSHGMAFVDSLVSPEGSL